jgi:transcriptional regulator with XRE-family HTH domain
VVLRLYREAAGVGMSDVGSALDLSKQMVSKMENGDASIEAAGRYRAAVDLIATGYGTGVTRP